MKQAEAEALFTLAGFKVTKTWELANMYWGGTEHIAKHEGGRPPTGPWWLLLTEYGPIRIGWRKRVIEIEWDATPLRVVVTEDDVTKEQALVHACGAAKALEYLTALHVAALRLGDTGLKEKSR